MDEPEEEISYSISTIGIAVSTSTSTYDVKKQRKIIREWAKNNLVGKIIRLPFLEIDITFTGRGVKEALNQPHKRLYHKNEAIKDIESALMLSEFVKSVSDNTGDINYVYHYLKTTINEDESFIVLKEIKKEKRAIFYSIVDNIKN
jgi:Large polyvalent protein-associated domain 3